MPGAVERVHEYYRAGPSADYSGDSGGIGEVPPLRFVVPEGAGRVGVAELSFTYTTHGKGPFFVSANVGAAGDTGDTGDANLSRPRMRPLAPAPDGASTTVRFLVPDLTGGGTYAAYAGVNSVFPGPRGQNVIHTRKVLLTVDLTPR